MNAPRVLVSGVALAQPMGGVRRHNQELLPRAAKLLAERGGSLAFMGGREPVALDLPASITRLTSSVRARPVLARAALEGVWLRRHLAAARAAGTPFDLVHTDHLPAPRWLGLPFTITLHDLKSVALASQGLARRIVGRRVIADGVSRAARVIAVSETLRGELRELFGVPETMLAVVANAADHLAVLPRSRGADAPILCVGHLEPRKQVEVLLRALALDPSLPDLALAGEPKGDHGERLAALARTLGVEARVRFLGLLGDSELSKLYATCGCVAIASLRESSCIPALEALHAGAPLAVSDIPALRAHGIDERAFFDPHDAAAAARAIRFALGQRECPPRALATWDRSAEALVACWTAAAQVSAGG